MVIFEDDKPKRVADVVVNLLDLKWDMDSTSLASITSEIELFRSDSFCTCGCRKRRAARQPGDDDDAGSGGGLGGDGSGEAIPEDKDGNVDIVNEMLAQHSIHIENDGSIAACPEDEGLNMEGWTVDHEDLESSTINKERDDALQIAKKILEMPGSSSMVGVNECDLQLAVDSGPSEDISELLLGIDLAELQQSVQQQADTDTSNMPEDWTCDYLLQRLEKWSEAVIQFHSDLKYIFDLRGGDCCNDKKKVMAAIRDTDLSLVCMEDVDGCTSLKYFHWDSVANSQGRVTHLDNNHGIVYRMPTTRTEIDLSRVSIIIPATGKRMMRAKGMYRDRMSPEILRFQEFCQAAMASPDCNTTEDASLHRCWIPGARAFGHGGFPEMGTGLL
eukprot:4909061-Karenia_brevis.AAC.1